MQKETQPDEHYVIDVKNLCKSFGKKEVVKNVNLQIKQGEIYGFLGPNGSGKTTTIRMICGLLEPTSGQGHCLGYDIVKQSAEIKKNVGYMTQRFSLYEDLTLRENLEFIARIYGVSPLKEAVDEAVSNLGFSHERQHQLTGTLSGGWKQRLALAAAMLHKPRVLLLDEPTAGVDPKARRAFWEQIHDLSGKGITTLVSTHYMDEAERCSQLAYIAYGKILTRGTITQVIDNEKITVFSVGGKNLHDVSSALRCAKGIEQVTAFGQTLHIVGHDKHAMEESIAPFKTKDYEWKEIPSTLEDVFINLVDRSRDNFA